MTTPKSDDELLPCRCGERDQIFICDRSPYGFDRPRQNIYTMECRECGFAVVAFVDPWDEQKKPLAEEWNRRALLQQPKRVEEIEEITEARIAVCNAALVCQGPFYTVNEDTARHNLRMALLKLNRLLLASGANG